MAAFYRRTKIEELGEKHPGLLEYVEQCQRRRLPGPELAAAIMEQWGETVSPQVLSNHYVLRVWPEENDEIKNYRLAKTQFRVLREEAEADPDCDSAKMIELLTINGIVQQREQLLETDPLKLMAELRKSRELASGMEIERGKLAVAKQQAENEKRALEVKVAQLEKERERERKAVAGVVADKSVTAEEARRKIQEMYSIA